ncbi:MAG: PAS domain S-box protein [Acetobacteraceae bacterium]|nr:PAS domain S-box protein [Pseudomonadota bacterium]
MFEKLASWLFASDGLTPHGFCLLWSPWLIRTYAASDLAIGIAYFTIPIFLLVFARRRRDLAFPPVFLLFAAFILLCGATHILDVITLWQPAYGIQAMIKALTALASLTTAIALWWLMPAALALPSPAQWEATNAALRESESHHRARFEYSPVPLYTLDNGDVITGVSDSWLSLLGYRRDEVVGRPVSDFLVPGDRRALDAERTELLTRGALHDVERRFIARDGAIIEGQVSARLERRGDRAWVLSALTDVTARRRAEAALRASEERLHQAQKMEAVGQLTGGIAHDFNNMLQGIGGGLELMERRISQGRTEDLTRHIAGARQAVERAARLTHRMLAFARRQALQPRPVEPDSLIRGMEELIRRTLGPEIRLELQLHDGTWSALCDPNQLESALLNLAINARDAMPDGGTLTITTVDREVSEDDAREDGMPEVGGWVQITVADTGTGMPPDVLERAFEPFFTTKPIGEGTGLGLSQIYGFVQQSGGFVRLESSVGVGTTMHLFLPRHERIEEQASPGSASSPANPADGAVAGATILVVEDEDGVRNLAVEALRDLGCRIIQAADGPSGMRIVQSGIRLNLLITDVGLPGINGRQLAEAARAIRPGLPVLLITGYAGRALDNAALPAGMEVIRKPFPLEELAARVRARLQTDAPDGPAEAE